MEKSGHILCLTCANNNLTDKSVDDVVPLLGQHISSSVYVHLMLNVHLTLI